MFQPIAGVTPLQGLLVLVVVAALGLYLFLSRRLKRARADEEDQLFLDNPSKGDITFEIEQYDSTTDRLGHSVRVTVKLSGRLEILEFHKTARYASIQSFLRRGYGGPIAGVLEQFDRAPEGLSRLNGMTVKVCVKTGKIRLFLSGEEQPETHSLEAHFLEQQ